MSSEVWTGGRTGIRCEGLWKRYRPRIRAKYRTLRDELVAVFRRKRGAEGDRQRWAVRDLTLSVGPGEALGIIGPNGSGKSTLLKLIAGVTYPTRGLIEVRGRTGAFIELGSGMHPELSGRENISLYGTILGLGRREIQRKFDSIVEFSELAPHLDLPVKQYSSGMKIRLGFSIAAHVDPDILLVDEVLAVGDAAFQRKCLERIGIMLASDVSILYVSHELASLERLCPRALWLDGGVVRALGPSTTVVSAYLAEVEQHMTIGAIRNLGSDGFRLERISLSDGNGTARAHFSTGDPLTVELFYDAREGFTPSQVAVKLLDDRMRTIALAVWDAPTGKPWPQGQGVLRCSFASVPLMPRLYQIWAQVLRRPDDREVVPWSHLATFAITEGAHPGGPIATMTRGRERPLVALPATWRWDTLAPAPRER